MATSRERQTDVYSTIFDFIFSVQRKRRNKPFPKQIDGLSDYASTLIEIGTQPLVYPLESVFDQINGTIAKATEMDLGGGVDVGGGFRRGQITGGLGSGVFTNPVGYSRAEIGKNRAKAKWASIGGGLHQYADSALLSLYARSNGASSKTAFSIGSIFSDLFEREMYEEKKDPTEWVLYNLAKSKEEKEASSEQKIQKTKEEISQKADELASRHPGISKESIIKHINDISEYSSKKDRKAISEKYFSNKNISEQEKNRISKTIDQFVQPPSSPSITQLASKKRLNEKSGVRTKDLLPERFAEDIKAKEEKLFERSVDLRTGVITSHNQSISKEKLKDHIWELQKVESKNERIRKTTQYLMDTGLDTKKRLEISYMLWGDIKDTKDQGLYKVEVQPEINRIQNQYGITNAGIINLLRRKEENRLNPKKAEKEIYSFLKKERGMESQTAYKLTNEINSLNFNDGYNIAEDTVYWALATDILENMKEKGDYSAIPFYKDRVKQILSPSNKDTLGMKVERTLMVGRWISNADAWGSILLDGKWEKFGVADVNFTHIVDEIKVKDDEGKEVGSYYQAADSVIGRSLGRLYYFHPNNLVKGLVLDGSLWLKMATDKETGIVNKESFAYLLNQMSLKNSLGAIAKPLKGLSSNIVKVIDPVAKGVQKFIKNVLTKVLAGTGVGGLLVNLIMSVVGDKITYIVNQIVIIVILGIVGILFVIFGAVSSVFYSDEYEEAMLNESIEQTESVIGEETFTNEDFQIP
jgi:hypothetical protein